MRNLLFIMSYDGTNYHGFQIQKNGVTIQSTLNDCFSKLTKEEINVIGCGRTDAGVHGINYAFNVKTNSNIPCEKFPIALNTLLPPDISIKSCKEVENDFHSCFSALNKTYKYVISRNKIKNPFLGKYSYMYTYDLNIENIRKGAKYIEGEHDFKAFMAQGSTVKNTVRTIYKIDIIEKDDFLIFEVCGNGFLYNMVRIIIGTLLDVGTGRISPDTVQTIIDKKEREKAGMTVPPYGLYLKEVYYGK